MTLKYYNNDMFYDVESLQNVFTVAQYYPKQNKLIVSFLQEPTRKIINNARDLQLIKDRVMEVNPTLQGEPPTFIFEDLDSPLPEGYMLDGVHIQSVIHFAHRFGVASKDNYINNYDAHKPVQVPTQRVHNGYYPIKDTDTEFNPDIHGRYFGYNSDSYDLTILAHFIDNIPPKLLNFACTPQGQFMTNAYMSSLYQQGTLTNEDMPNMTPRDLRAYNDLLFTKYGDNMKLALKNPEDYRNHFDSYYIREGWVLTNRHVDVMQQAVKRIALKRAAGLMGIQIKDSNKLTGTNAYIHNIDEFADLIAYNVSDNLCTKALFEHKVWQNNYKVKMELLKNMPQVIYKEKGNTDLPDIHPKKVNPYRLTVNSTSARFVERIIAPYKPLSDIPAVSFMYPNEKVAEEMGVRSYDVLETVKAWADKNIGVGEFDNVYNYYKSLVGHNINENLKNQMIDVYNEMTGQMEKRKHDHVYPFINIKDQYIAHNQSKYQNTHFFYRTPEKDVHGKAVWSTCMATFSNGGIHGQEIDKKLFDDMMLERTSFRDALRKAKTMYNHDANLAYAQKKTKDVNGQVIEPPTFRVYKPVNGTQGFKYEWVDITLRHLCTAKSKLNNAEWRDEPCTDKEDILFKYDSASKKMGLNPKLVYVSIGKANHEDFTSYYPNLLIKLAAFLQTNGTDPYAQIYRERVALKDEVANMVKQWLKEKKEMTEEMVRLVEKVRENEIDIVNLEQEAKKLLLNAASGAADVLYNTNIRMNNTILSMRIIGQLFAWMIGQAQTLHGARIPSTNTDGLYTMDIDEETNKRVLEDISKEMYVGIKPEVLTRFVTKDSNNRLEIHGSDIVSARGGTLTSYKGASPDQSIPHPPITDYVLANYLKDHPDPANHNFDEELAYNIIHKFINDNRHDKPEDVLIRFQWIIAASHKSNRYPFIVKHIKTENGFEEISGDAVEMIHQYNRVFLTKPTRESINGKLTPVYKFMQTVSPSIVRPQTMANRKKQGLPLVEHSLRGLRILEHNGVELENIKDIDRKDISINKVTKMPDNANVFIENSDLRHLNYAQSLIDNLDLAQYVYIIRSSFEKSWTNMSADTVDMAKCIAS